MKQKFFYLFLFFFNIKIFGMDLSTFYAENKKDSVLKTLISNFKQNSMTLIKKGLCIDDFRFLVGHFNIKNFSNKDHKEKIWKISDSFQHYMNTAIVYPAPIIVTLFLLKKTKLGEKKLFTFFTKKEEWLTRNINNIILKKTHFDSATFLKNHSYINYLATYLKLILDVFLTKQIGYSILYTIIYCFNKNNYQKCYDDFKKKNKNIIDNLQITKPEYGFT